MLAKKRDLPGGRAPAPVFRMQNVRARGRGLGHARAAAGDAREQCVRSLASGGDLMGRDAGPIVGEKDAWMLAGARNELGVVASLKAFGVAPE